MPRENKNQYPILGFLSKKDRSGYDLANYSKRIGQHYWTEFSSQVYGTLKKLEEDGFVSSYVDENSGARNRRVYSITPAGLEHLKAWLEQPAEKPLYRDELLLKLSNAEHLPKGTLLKHFEAEERRLTSHLKELKDVYQHIKADHSNRLDQQHLFSLYEYKQSYTETRLSWVRRMIEKERQNIN